MSEMLLIGLSVTIFVFLWTALWFRGERNRYKFLYEDRNKRWGDLIECGRDIGAERLLLSNLKEASTNLKNEIYLEMDRKQRQTVIYRGQR